MDEMTTFKGFNSEGEEVEYEILFTFESQESGKNYMLYTDNSLDAHGHTKVFAASFVPGDNSKLTPIESEDEWLMIRQILMELQGM